MLLFGYVHLFMIFKFLLFTLFSSYISFVSHSIHILCPRHSSCPPLFVLFMIIFININIIITSFLLGICLENLNHEFLMFYSSFVPFPISSLVPQILSDFHFACSIFCVYLSFSFFLSISLFFSFSLFFFYLLTPSRSLYLLSLSIYLSNNLYFCNLDSRCKTNRNLLQTQISKL